MNRIIRSFLLVVLLFSCKERASSDKDLSGLSMKIFIPDTISRDSVLIVNVSLKNESDTDKRFLFDLPKPFSIKTGISDINGKSLFGPDQRELLSSTVYTEEEMQNYYYTLGPGQELRRNFRLNELLLTEDGSGRLPAGKYFIQLKLENIVSDRQLIIVK